MKRLAFLLVMLALLVGITVPGCDGEEGGPTYTPTTPLPAVFSVSNLSIEPAEVSPNEAVTISVSVANTGGSQGSHSVVLNINGVQEEIQSVTITAGSSETATFSVTREDTGTYTATIGSLSGSFTVMSAMSAEGTAEAAIAAYAELNTYQFDMDMEMTITIPGETPTTTQMDMSGTSDMADGKMYREQQITTSMPPETIQASMEMYLIDDWMYVKMEGADIPPEVAGTWFKMQIPEDDLEDFWEQQEIAYQQHYLLMGFSEVELLGTEMINGIECYKLQVTPDTEKLLESILTGIEGVDLGLDPEEVISDYSYLVWIAKDTYFIVKSIVEMTATIEGETANLAQTTLLHDINEPVTIELPPEAEAAEEIPM